MDEDEADRMLLTLALGFALALVSGCVITGYMLAGV